MRRKNRRGDDSQSKNTAGTRTSFRRRLFSPSPVPLKRGRGGERVVRAVTTRWVRLVPSHTPVDDVVRGPSSDVEDRRSRSDFRLRFTGRSGTRRHGKTRTGPWPCLSGSAHATSSSRRLGFALACSEWLRNSRGRHQARASRGGGGGGGGSSLIACPTLRLTPALLRSGSWCRKWGTVSLAKGEVLGSSDQYSAKECA